MILGLLAVLPLVCAYSVEVRTAEQLVQAVRLFAQQGSDLDVHVARNLSFAEANTSSWPVRDLARGTLKIMPAPDLQASNTPVFIDAAMLAGLTEPLAGAYMVLRRLHIMNLCAYNYLFNPGRGWSSMTSTGVLLFGRQR